MYHYVLSLEHYIYMIKIYIGYFNIVKLRYKNVYCSPV